MTTKSDRSRIERHARYPIVFKAKYLTLSYVIKAQAAKTIIAANNIWAYRIYFSGYQFYNDKREKG